MGFRFYFPIFASSKDKIVYNDEDFYDFAANGSIRYR